MTEKEVEEAEKELQVIAQKMLNVIIGEDLSLNQAIFIQINLIISLFIHAQQMGLTNSYLNEVKNNLLLELKCLDQIIEGNLKDFKEIKE